jgi:hypothetical protein
MQAIMAASIASALIEREVGVEAIARLLHFGTARLRQGQADEARRYFEEAVSECPTNVLARSLLAQAHFQGGELEDALILYESLVLEYPESIGLSVNTALVLVKLGRAPEARPILERVVRLAPDHRRAWGYLGVTLEQLGALEEAEEAYVAGHFATAALRVRRLSSMEPRVADGQASLTESVVLPAAAGARQRTIPPDPWRAPRHAAVPALGGPRESLFRTTLPPPDMVRDDSVDSSEGVAPETTLAPPDEPPTSDPPQPNRPIVPLLDAALASLLVVPHEATVVRHPTGAVLVGLVERNDPCGGGFAARVDVVHALAGGLRAGRRHSNPPPSAEPFRAGLPFTHFTGTGHVVLIPPPGTCLTPLGMDAEVAFFREDLIVGFDEALLSDLGMIHRAHGSTISVVRFRGDGVVVLALDHKFLAYDVRGDDAITLRAEALLGWIGNLSPDPYDDRTMNLLTFKGEGTVLFRVPEGQSDSERTSK